MPRVVELSWAWLSMALGQAFSSSACLRSSIFVRTIGYPEHVFIMVLGDAQHLGLELAPVMHGLEG